MREEYSISEIIFGLRKEYLEMEKLLRELKNDVIVNNKNIEKIEFDLYNICGLGMRCTFYKHLNPFQKYIKELLIRHNHPYLFDIYGWEIGKDHGYVSQYLNGKCYIESKYQIFLSNDFSKKVHQIIDSEFAQNISHRFDGYNKNTDSRIQLEPDIYALSIDIDRDYKYDRTAANIVTYYPKTDEIVQNTMGYNIRLKTVLESSVPASILKEYHIRKIDEWIPKLVVVDNEEPLIRNERYQIIEEEQQIILRTKKLTCSFLHL